MTVNVSYLGSPYGRGHSGATCRASALWSCEQRARSMSYFARLFGGGARANTHDSVPGVASTARARTSRPQGRAAGRGSDGGGGGAGVSGGGGGGSSGGGTSSNNGRGTTINSGGGDGVRTRAQATHTAGHSSCAAAAKRAQNGTSTGGDQPRGQSSSVKRGRQAPLAALMGSVRQDVMNSSDEDHKHRKDALSDSVAITKRPRRHSSREASAAAQSVISKPGSSRSGTTQSLFSRSMEEKASSSLGAFGGVDPSRLLLTGVNSSRGSSRCNSGSNDSNSSGSTNNNNNNHNNMTSSSHNHNGNAGSTSGMGQTHNAVELVWVTVPPGCKKGEIFQFTLNSIAYHVRAPSSAKFKPFERGRKGFKVRLPSMRPRIDDHVDAQDATYAPNQLLPAHSTAAGGVAAEGRSTGLGTHAVTSAATADTPSSMTGGGGGGGCRSRSSRASNTGGGRAARGGRGSVFGGSTSFVNAGGLGALVAAAVTGWQKKTQQDQAAWEDAATAPARAHAAHHMSASATAPPKSPQPMMTEHLDQARAASTTTTAPAEASTAAATVVASCSPPPALWTAKVRCLNTAGTRWSVSFHETASQAHYRFGIFRGDRGYVDGLCAKAVAALNEAAVEQHSKATAKSKSAAAVVAAAAAAAAANQNQQRGRHGGRRQHTAASNGAGNGNGGHVNNGGRRRAGRSEVVVGGGDGTAAGDGPKGGHRATSGWCVSIRVSIRSRPSPRAHPSVCCCVIWLVDSAVLRAFGLRFCSLGGVERAHAYGGLCLFAALQVERLLSSCTAPRRHPLTHDK